MPNYTCPITGRTYPVIDDSYNHVPIGQGTGYTGRDLQAYPLAQGHCTRAFTGARYKDSDFQSIIAEKTAKRTWIKDKCDDAGLTVKNQRSSSYCWIHAPVHGMEVNYILQGGIKLVLSAFYPGSRIKNGRNQGGSGIEGAQWLAKNGTCKEEFWAPMKFSGSVTPEIQNSASLHKIVMWEDLDPRDMNAIFSNVCNDIPVTVGIPAWSHEVLITFLVWKGGKVVPGIDNSWDTTWGDNGRGLLEGAYARFDEAGSIANTTPAAQ